MPIVLGVVNAGDSLAPLDAGVRVAGLGHPDGLATSGGDGGIVGGVEQGARVLDVVALAVLVVGVFVNTDPINGVDNGLVGAVGPGIPRVDVADGDGGDGRVGEVALELLDEFGDDIGAGTNSIGVVLQPGDRNTVQIFAADGNTNDEVG